MKLVLNSISEIEELAWQELNSFLVERALVKNEFLWKQDQVCRYLVFVKKGFLRSYTIINGIEKTLRFYNEKDVFYEDYSFLTQKPSKSYCEALEACELVLVPRGSLYLMFDKYKSFERLGRIAVEKIHIQGYDFLHLIQSFSAKEKYDFLLKNEPQILRRAPLKMIASYLDMTPEHLSRIRNALVKR